MGKDTIGFGYIVSDTGYQFQRQQTLAIDVVLQRLAQQAIDSHDVNLMKDALKLLKGQSNEKDAATTAIEMIKTHLALEEETDPEYQVGIRERGTRNRVKAQPESAPRTQAVFRINPKTTSIDHIKLLYNELSRLGWLSAESQEEFLRLFSGKDNDCVITWHGRDKETDKTVGVGTLRELFAELVKQNLVSCTSGEYISVLESHFRNAKGAYLANVKGSGRASSSTRPKVEWLIRMLKTSYGSVVDNNDDDFNDIRYGHSEWLDDHRR